MDVKYTVFSAAEVKASMTVDIPGVGLTPVEIPSLVVQLIPVVGDSTLRLQFVGAEIEEATPLFVVGAVIVASLSAGA